MLKKILFCVFSYLLSTAFCDTAVNYSGPRYVEEGSTFVITCRLSASLNLKWTKNSAKLVGPEYNQTMESKKEDNVQVSKLIVRNAHANHSGEYRCYTFSPEIFHEISVIFDIEGKSSFVELNLNGDTYLQCNMSQDSSVNITWLRNSAQIDFIQSKDKYARENNTLVILKGAGDADAGTYVCAVVGDLSRNITFILKTRVRIEKFEKSINAVQGDKLALPCKVYGNPVPVITWYKDNVLIKEANSTQHIKFSDYNNVTDSQMIIEQLDENDRAVYKCLATNDVNEANVTVMVRVKDKLAALWPFLGILAEVAVLCTIIFIYEKRRAKQEYDESDTDPNNESKPTTEQKKEDVRQRK